MDDRRVSGVEASRRALLPHTVKEATEHYLNQEDTFGQWLNECCERVPGAFTHRLRLW